MKFCMVSGLDFNGKFTGKHQDCIFDWVTVFDGVHRSNISIRDNLAEMNEYDVVLLVDADRYLEDAIKIAEDCTCKTVWCAEGTIGRYMALPFAHWKLFHHLLQRVDLIGAFEEDRIPWYRSLWPDTKVFFMHTPASDELLSGRLRSREKVKVDRILVCCNLGFGPPHVRTNLITSLGVIRRIGRPCLLCEIQEEHARFIAKEMDIPNLSFIVRVHYAKYMTRIIGPSVMLLNPSDLIGTSRNAIVGAGIGTPVIGNMHSHTQQRLFPELGAYIYDTEKMVELASRLYEGGQFYREICDRALEAAQYYSRENARRRFEEALE